MLTQAYSSHTVGFWYYSDRMLTAAIKETAKDLKSETKGEVPNSEMLKKKHFGFVFSDFLPPKKLASVDIDEGVLGGVLFCWFFFFNNSVICSQRMGLRPEESYHISH